MKRITALLCFALCATLGLMLAPTRGFAQRELFTPPATFAPLPASFLQSLEPASGDNASTKDSHDSKEAHPEATGHSEKQKSFVGKEIGGLKPLPKVKIGAYTVARQIEITESVETAATPPELQRKDFAQVLMSRINFTPFAHSPQVGEAKAPITVVIFEDLACISCSSVSVDINKALYDVFAPPNPAVSDSLAGLVRVLWVHTPAERWQGSNLAAFYSKVAGQYGKFWPFREALLAASDRDTPTLFALLTGLGIDPKIIRQTMLTEARRYYRELDGDVLQAKSFGIGHPPTVLVNGIRVGQSGIPIAMLPDVLLYVKNRYQAGLNEPPL